MYNSFQPFQSAPRRNPAIDSAAADKTTIKKQAKVVVTIVYNIEQ
jgi:hypothetical protein